jgi:hypothetical protein
LTKGRILGVIALGAIALATAQVVVSATSGASGGPITQVKAVSGNTQKILGTQFPDFGTTPWRTIAERSVSVPSGQRALILARFSAEARCPNSYDSSSKVGSCQVRIRIGNAEANPVSGADFEFAPRSGIGPASYSFERWRVVGAGTYAVRAQWRVVGPAQATFILDDWVLTVLRSRS